MTSGHPTHSAQVGPIHIPRGYAHTDKPYPAQSPIKSVWAELCARLPGWKVCFLRWCGVCLSVMRVLLTLL